MSVKRCVRKTTVFLTSSRSCVESSWTTAIGSAAQSMLFSCSCFIFPTKWLARRACCSDFAAMESCRHSVGVGIFLYWQSYYWQIVVDWLTCREAPCRFRRSCRRSSSRTRARSNATWRPSSAFSRWSMQLKTRLSSSLTVDIQLTLVLFSANAYYVSN